MRPIRRSCSHPTASGRGWRASISSPAFRAVCCRFRPAVAAGRGRESPPKSSFHNEPLCRRAALGGTRRRPQSHPHQTDAGTPCVLASHSPIAPRRRRPIMKGALGRHYTPSMAVDERRIAILGAGKIGESLLAGLLLTGGRSVDEIVVTGRREERMKELSERYGVTATLSNAEAVSRAAGVVIAVKPPNFAVLLGEIAPLLSPEQKVLSIAAAIPTSLI